MLHHEALTLAAEGNEANRVILLHHANPTEPSTIAGAERSSQDPRESNMCATQSRSDRSMQRDHMLLAVVGTNIAPKIFVCLRCEHDLWKWEKKAILGVESLPTRLAFGALGSVRVTWFYDTLQETACLPNSQGIVMYRG